MEFNSTSDMFICEWKIPNFVELLNDNRKRKSIAIESPSFVSEYPFPAKWKFKLFYKPKNSTENPDCMVFHIKNPCYAIYSRDSLYVKNAKGEIIKIDNSSYMNEMSEKENWKRYLFSNKSFLDDPDLFLPNGSLSIMCLIYVDKYISMEKSLEEVENVSNFVINDESCDVTIVVNNEEFRVHKSILCDKSPVFAAMFSYETIENKKNRVNIIDINAEIIKEMLRYMYTSKVENIDDIAIELLIAANKYDITELEDLCAISLLNEITIGNAEEMLSIAKYYSAKLLLKHTLNFLQQLSEPLIQTGISFQYLCD